MAADILIVTSRNVVTTGGELSLIKNRAQALRDNWGLSSDIIALKNTALNVASGSEAFGPGTYIETAFMNPAALLGGYEKLAQVAEGALRANRYKAVIVSGVGVFRFAKRFKQAAGPQTLVCADVHGYYGDGAEIAKTERFPLRQFHQLAAQAEKHEQLKYLRHFDRVFVVTEAYRTFLTETAGCRTEQFYVVPCAIGARPHFTAEEEAAHRAHYRAKYGVADGELLLVYSGGASAWQCIPETVQLYQQILQQRPAKLLMLSGDPDGIRAAIAQAGVNPNVASSVAIDSYAPAELPKVFCAADFCLMLRGNIPTNHYAYPNKFLEYAAAHRPTITTAHVWDIAKQLERFGAGVIYNGDTDELLAQMNAFSCPAENYDALVEGASFAHTLVPFAHDLGAAAASGTAPQDTPCKTAPQDAPCK